MQTRELLTLIRAFFEGLFTKLNKKIIKLTQQVGTKQDKLVSGTNIKTINGISLLGGGNIPFPSDEIYTVIYGESDEGQVFSDVRDAFVNNGKTVILIDDPGGEHERRALLTYFASTEDEDGVFYFTGDVTVEDGKNGVYRYILNVNDGWMRNFHVLDTKNTTGSTDTSNKIFLVGATTQAANPQTYSDNEVYTKSGVLTTKSVQVGVGAATMEYDSTNNCIKFIFD